MAQHLFEVWRDKQCLYWTDHKECVPDERTQKDMKRAGLKIKTRSKG